MAKSSTPGSRRRWLSGVLGIGIAAATLTGLCAAPASAAIQCDPGGDVCVVVPDTVQTPLGTVTVTVNAANVVTVHLGPVLPNTIVLGVPFSYPQGPPILAGYTRTTIDTAGGLISIDTIQSSPGPLSRFPVLNLAIVSILPPGPPCRAHTVGSTVTFAPIVLPGPPA